jgi:outer membrane murein-binding lipoprotein Lpp
MKTTSSRMLLVAAGVASLLLAGCASTGNASHAEQTGASGRAGHAAMDMQAMCEMHRKMMAGKAPAERQAMMEQHMKSMSMSPEEMGKHMQAMQEQCK